MILRICLEFIKWIEEKMNSLIVDKYSNPIFMSFILSMVTGIWIPFFDFNIWRIVAWLIGVCFFCNLFLTKIILSPDKIVIRSIFINKMINWYEIIEVFRKERFMTVKSEPYSVENYIVWDYLIKVRNKKIYLSNSCVSGSSELCEYIFKYANQAKFITQARGLFFFNIKMLPWHKGAFSYETGKYIPRAQRNKNIIKEWIKFFIVTIVFVLSIIVCIVLADHFPDVMIKIFGM